MERIRTPRADHKNSSEVAEKGEALNIDRDDFSKEVSDETVGGPVV